MSELIRKLLSRDEDIDLDFKDKIDIDSKRGKRRFQKVMLALANSPIKNAYLVLGVREKNKEKVVVGLQEGIDEERIQNIVKAYCSPPIPFWFRIFNYEEKDVGVIGIYGTRRPYRPRKSADIDSSNEDWEDIVFIRHGSTTAVATTDEIMEMERERSLIDMEVLESIDSNVLEVIDAISGSSWRNREMIENGQRDRSIEYAFIGIVSGVLLSFLQINDAPSEVLGVLFLPTIIGIIASAVKIVRFGLLRSVFVGICISTTYLMVLRLVAILPLPLSMVISSQTDFFVWGALNGILGGLVANWIVNRLHVE